MTIYSRLSAGIATNSERPALKGSCLQFVPPPDRPMASIMKRYAKLARLDPGQFAGNSLRSGFLTSAVEAGASIWKLAEQSHHHSLDHLARYARRVDPFREHAGASFLLTQLAAWGLRLLIGDMIYVVAGPPVPIEPPSSFRISPERRYWRDGLRVASAKADLGPQSRCG